MKEVYRTRRMPPSLTMSCIMAVNRSRFGWLLEKYEWAILGDLFDDFKGFEITFHWLPLAGAYPCKVPLRDWLRIFWFRWTHRRIQCVM